MDLNGVRISPVLVQSPLDHKKQQTVWQYIAIDHFTSETELIRELHSLLHIIIIQT